MRRLFVKSTEAAPSQYLYSRLLWGEKIPDNHLDVNETVPPGSLPVSCPHSVAAVAEHRLTEKVLKPQSLPAEERWEQDDSFIFAVLIVVFINMTECLTLTPLQIFARVALDCMKATQQYANDTTLTLTENDYFGSHWASGRVSLINLSRFLFLSVCSSQLVKKGVGVGDQDGGGVHRCSQTGGCAMVNGVLWSIMAQLRHGVYTYFMTVSGCEPGCIKLSTCSRTHTLHIQRHLPPRVPPRRPRWKGGLTC